MIYKYQQLYDNDCGLCALKMLLSFTFRHKSFAYLKTPKGPAALSLADLIRLADTYGLPLRAMRIKNQEGASCSPPFIRIYESAGRTHAVFVYRRRKNHVLFIDPADGKKHKCLSSELIGSIALAPLVSAAPITLHQGPKITFVLWRERVIAHLIELASFVYLLGFYGGIVTGLNLYLSFLFLLLSIMMSFLSRYFIGKLVHYFDCTWISPLLFFAPERRELIVLANRFKDLIFSNIITILNSLSVVVICLVGLYSFSFKSTIIIVIDIVLVCLEVLFFDKYLRQWKARLLTLETKLFTERDKVAFLDLQNELHQVQTWITRAYYWRTIISGLINTLSVIITISLMPAFSLSFIAFLFYASQMILEKGKSLFQIILNQQDSRRTRLLFHNEIVLLQDMRASHH